MKADCQRSVLFYETDNLEIIKAKGINERYLNK